jgi:hypothetical protein
MRNRAFFRQLCGSVRLQLHICRCSDPALFTFYRQLSDSAENVQVWVERARAQFPPIAGPSPINLVFSHERRVQLNEELMQTYKPTDRACFFTEPGPCNAEETRPQPLWLWEG